MESTTLPATDRFKDELRAFCQTYLGIADQAVQNKVVELTVSEHKKMVDKANLDDLNDTVKTFFYSGEGGSSSSSCSGQQK